MKGQCQIYVCLKSVCMAHFVNSSGIYFKSRVSIFVDNNEGFGLLI